MLLPPCPAAPRRADACSPTTHRHPLLSLLPITTGEAEAQAARLREQLQQQEGKASSLAAQADEAQRQLAAWQVG